MGRIVRIGVSGGLIILLAVGVYFNIWSLGTQAWTIYHTVLPCRSPISYSLGIIDTRFGVSDAYFLNAIKDAEELWEQEYGAELFSYAETGGHLIIELAYDDRQAVTDELQKVDQVIDDQESTITSVEEQMDMKLSALESKKNNYQQRVSEFERRQRAYAQKVSMWNSRGGAPSDVYDSLQAEKSALEAEAAALQALVAGINQEISDFNSLVGERNRIATIINDQVETYNEIGATRGEEFTEGEYIRDLKGPRISIYEFDSRQKLVRLLAHELGHAIGIDDHVEDPNAIMYYLNEGTSEEVSADDLFALYEVCGVKNTAVR